MIRKFSGLGPQRRAEVVKRPEITASRDPRREEHPAHLSWRFCYGRLKQMPLQRGNQRCMQTSYTCLTAGAFCAGGVQYQGWRAATAPTLKGLGDRAAAPPHCADGDAEQSKKFDIDRATPAAAGRINRHGR